MDFRKQSDKLLSHAVGEVFLRGISAKILQRKHSQGMNHGTGRRCQAMPPFAPEPDGNGDNYDEKCHDGLRPESSSIYVPWRLLRRWNRNRRGTFTAVVGDVHRRNKSLSAPPQVSTAAVMNRGTDCRRPNPITFPSCLVFSIHALSA